MPEGTSAGKFLKAIRNRDTDLTKTLSRLFRKPEKIDDGVLSILDNDNALLSTNINWEDPQNPNRGLRSFMKGRLKAHNPVDKGTHTDTIVEKILAHIEEWPNARTDAGYIGKEQLRYLLVAVIKAAKAGKSHRIKFIWEISRQLEEEQIDSSIPISDDPVEMLRIINEDLQEDETIKVTFTNPWSKVRDEAYSDQVEVGIGPEVE